MVGIEDFRKIISGRKKKGRELMPEHNESQLYRCGLYTAKRNFEKIPLFEALFEKS